MPTPTQVLTEKVESLTSQLASLAESVNGIQEKVSNLFQTGPDKNLAVAAPMASLPPSIEREFGASDPIPALYRETVDKCLSKSFGIHNKAHSDAAQFTFTIIVPERYSTLTPEQKALQHVDIRPKVITYAEGVNGVKEWADLVFKSFSPSLQAMITSERLSTGL